MAYELKDGQGSLFKNDRKERENHPDYTGTIKINGQEFYLSAWLKDGSKGKFFSMSAKPKDAPRQERSQGGPQRRQMEPEFSRDLDDDIPW